MPLHQDSPELSAFRQIPHTFSSMKKRDTGGCPESSKSLARKFLSKLNGLLENESHKAVRYWASCVPKPFSDKCSPRNVRDGVLYVEVCNAAARQELAFMERKILQQLKKIEGCSDVKKIRFL